MADAHPPLTAQQQLNDFRPEVLADRHDRQLSLLRATGELSAPPYDVLDLGGGSGVTAVWAARQGWPTTVVDIDPQNLEVLESYLRREERDLPIKVMVDDVARPTSVPPAAFDIVYLKDLVEHVPDALACLRTAQRALRPGGLIYVATTNVVCPIQLEYHGVGPYSWYPRWLKDRIRHYAMQAKPEIVRHTPYPALHWFSRRSLGSLLHQAGFARVWDLYDLVNAPRDLTRRTRLVYPLIRASKGVRALRTVADLAVVGLTMVAQNPHVEPRPGSGAR
jgi:2-polyprenyl-3-methyl-5-hydroxy-6-metoxy-1,4-benzoquinol methylase